MMVDNIIMNYLEENIDEIDIKEFVKRLNKTDQPFKDKSLEKFLMEKIDPKWKYVIKGFNDSNRITERKGNDIEKMTTGLLGYFFKKLKLQIRLESLSDIEDLMRFLTYIRPAFCDLSEEEIINRNREVILDDILNDVEIPSVKVNF